VRNSIKPENNFQQYAIINSKYQFDEGCAKFIYRGYEVSFSTIGYEQGSCLNEVCVLEQGESKPLLKTSSVEDAINQVNQRVEKAKKEDVFC
jgi:hypothetical protein